MTPDQFVAKWKASGLSERSASQQHFLNLCSVLSVPMPAEADPTGNTFTFEKGGTTATGGRALITSDTKRIEIHTNFTNTVKIVLVIELDDLLQQDKMTHECMQLCGVLCRALSAYVA